jgi:hypothetical protein
MADSVRITCAPPGWYFLKLQPHSVQVEQEIVLSAEKFPNCSFRHPGARFIPDRGISLMEIARTGDGFRLPAERQCTLEALKS